MARLPRAAQGDIIYHVLNRGNSRQRIFYSESDYFQFLKLLLSAQQQVAMRILQYCLMPNHWHFLLWPYHDGDLSRFIHWLCVIHTQQWHQSNGTVGTGHIYQGRYKSFPVEIGSHLVTVARYIERNALRAKLVSRAEDWKWSSLYQSLHDPLKETRPILTEFPIERPVPWIEYVNDREPYEDLIQLRKSGERGRPFGSDPWVATTAIALGIGQSLRPRGRPKLLK